MHLAQVGMGWDHFQLTMVAGSALCCDCGQGRDGRTCCHEQHLPCLIKGSQCGVLTETQRRGSDDLATPPPGIYLEDIQVKITQADTCTQVFSAALVRAAQLPPAWGKTRKLGLFSAIEKEQSRAICRKMDAMWESHIISERHSMFPVSCSS